MTLAEDFRVRAKQQHDAAVILLAADDLSTNARKQVAATAGTVNATLLSALADLVDYQERASRLDQALGRAATVLKRNDTIRKAAASGDWNEYDRLVAGGEPAVPVG